MCGIAGIIDFKGRNVHESEVKVMTDTISHRGPDGEGIWVNPSQSVGLGHRRLSIIDLSNNANQPMHYLDRYVIVFNGEIYNYVEIKNSLKSKGYQFQTSSDTEVLLALFDLKKERCLDDLDGMFAFVIWDSLEQKIFAARDRFGEKPFYYSVIDGRMFFASEMKAIWRAGVPKIVDNEMLYNFLEHNLIHHLKDVSRTFYSNISKLKSSHYLYFSLNQSNELNPVRYWSLREKISNAEVRLDDKYNQEKFFDLFKTSVERRLRSDVPVGSSLSGGLDSSSIVCMIDKLNNNQISQNTFSAVFPGYEKDERVFIDKVIEATSVTPYFVEPDLKGMLENFEKLFYHQEEPFGSSSIYAQFCVMKLAKESGVTVLLDGQGADEILGGYHYYYQTLEKEKRFFNDQPKNSNAEITVPYNGSPSIGFKSKLIGTVKHYFPFAVDVYKSLKRSKVAANFSPYTNSFYSEYSIIDKGYPVHNTLNDHLIHDLVDGNLENLLRFADRNSMAMSREVRLPYLSHELCEFVASLPSHYKIRDGWTKWLQRTSLSSLMPHDITWRKDKIGYEPPQKMWMKDQYFKDYTMESKRVLYNNGILSKTEANKIPGENSAHTRGDNSWNYMMAGILFKK